MEKLKIKIDEKIYEICLTKNKFVIGNDYGFKYKLNNVIKSFINKTKPSEYSLENGYNFIFLDDDTLSLSDYDIIEINDNNELMSNLKVSSKSFILKFLESITQDIEYSEEYQTLQIVFDDFISLLEHKVNSIDNDLKLSLSAIFTKKEIFKLLQIDVFENDLIINNLDLNINESIIIYLKMLNLISKYSTKRILCIMNIIFINNEILNLLKTISSNVYFLIFIERSEIPFTNSEDIYLCNNDLKIDLSCEQDLFELCQNNLRNLSISDMKKQLLNDVNEYIKI